MITTEKIEELKQQITMYGCALLADRDDEAERVFSKIEEDLLDLAQRALEPQGQALPELPEPRYLGGDEAYGDAVYGYGDGEMYAYARATLCPPTEEGGGKS